MWSLALVYSLEVPGLHARAPLSWLHNLSSKAVPPLQVYLAAGTVYGLEGQLTELEDAARCIHSGTDETELAHLEDQVATAAAQVHQAELQVRSLLSAQTEDHLAKGEGALFHRSRFKGSVVPTTSSVTWACMVLSGGFHESSFFKVQLSSSQTIAFVMDQTSL